MILQAKMVKMPFSFRPERSISHALWCHPSLAGGRMKRTPSGPLFSVRIYISPRDSEQSAVTGYYENKTIFGQDFQFLFICSTHLLRLIIIYICKTVQNSAQTCKHSKTAEDKSFNTFRLSVGTGEE